MPTTLTASSRERLLSAARTLFPDRGYEATTTAAIAKLAHTSESQLLKHFKDKSGLLAAVLEQGWKELNAAVRLAIVRIGSPVDQLNLSFDMLFSYLEQDKNFRSVFLLETDCMRTVVPGARE